MSDNSEPALAALLAELDGSGYDFVAPTPATHARVVARAEMQEAADLRGVFGWSLPFAPDLLPPHLFQALRTADLLTSENGRFKSRLRVSRVRGLLFVHSAYPTDDEDSVFLGPDSYRFADFVCAELEQDGRATRLVDMGGGAGVGALCAAALLPVARLTLLDLNPVALRLAKANARHAGREVELAEGGSLDAVDGRFDLAIANPPYLIDRDSRTYRDGGGMRGAQLSFEWALAAARRIEPGGRMLLYTGVAIADGQDELRRALERCLPEVGCTLAYREIDPDIFGEELEKADYRDVERIAAVGAVIEKPRGS